MQDYSIPNIYKSYNCPCFNCNERHTNCHSECEKYIEWKRERDIEKGQLKKSREQENESWIFAVKRRAKWARRKRG